MTIKELSQLYYLNKEILQQRKRLSELEALSTNITPQISGMPHAPGISDKVAQCAEEIADLKALISLNIQKYWYERNRLERYIAGIEDSLTRQVFTLRFVDGLTWVQVAHRIGGNTVSSVKMICYRYLENNNQ